LNSKVKVIHKTPAVKKCWNPESKSVKGNENNKLRALKFKVPKQPYTRLHPNKKKPDIKAPEIKYFRPASVEKEESRLKLERI
jgi:hypothetical protein